MKAASLVAVLVLAAALVATAQLGPAFEDYRLSVRAEGFSFEEAAEYSLQPSMLRHLLLPLVFPPHFEEAPGFLAGFFAGSSGMPWLLTVYPGAMILPLAALSLFSQFRKRTFIWLLVFIISIVLALGENAFLYRLFYFAFPAFRFPEKFILPANFSLLVMAAYGVEHLLSRLGKTKQGAAFLFVALFIFLVLDLFWAHRNLNPVREFAFYRAYDPNLQTILDDPSHFRVYVDPETTAPRGESATVLEHHRRWQRLLMPNLGILHNLFHVDGTSGLELRYQYLMTETLNTPWAQKIRFLKLANVKYIISQQKLDELDDLAGQLERVNPVVFKIKEPLPRAWMVGEILAVKKGSVQELIDPSFDPSTQAIGARASQKQAQTHFFKEVDSLQYEKDGRIRIKVTSDRPAILVLSESSYPGWRVYVNGEQAACLWLNLLFQGVELPSGQNEIVFQFRPEHFPAFVSVSFVSLFVVLSLLSWPLVPWKRKGKGFRLVDKIRDFT